MTPRFSPEGAAQLQFATLMGSSSPVSSGLPFGEGWRQELLAREGEALAALAWEVAQGESAEAHEPVMWLVAALLVSVRRGNTRLPWAGEGCTLAGLQAEWGVPDALTQQAEELVRAVGESLGECSSRLLGGPGEGKPIRCTREGLKMQRMHQLERRVMSGLFRLHQGFVGTEEGRREEALRDVLARSSMHGGSVFTLSPAQEEAVRAVASYPVTLISGGPGTGKTSVLAGVLRVLVRLGVARDAIALAAPTGKAAFRLQQALHAGFAAIGNPSEEDNALRAAPVQVETLHRLLGYNPQSGRFLHHENHRLPASVVCVDEASMIDLLLWERLLRSLPDGGQIVLLGDADQLPSVEPGAVFRDLLAYAATSAAVVHPVQLTQSHRMNPEDPSGQAILAAAQRVREGDLPGLLATPGVRVCASVADLTFRHVEFLEGAWASHGEAWLARWWEELLATAGEGWKETIQRVYPLDVLTEEESAALRSLLQPWGRMQIVCATRNPRWSTSTEPVNAALHRHLCRWAGEDPANPFCVGGPVLLQRNDPARKLYNGDQGVVVWGVSEGSTHRWVAFPRGEGWAVFRLEALRDQLVPAFAVTVHKAQGTEVDRLAFVLPDEELPLLTRELLYTAMTRSREAVLLVGRSLRLEQAMRRPLIRHTGP